MKEHDLFRADILVVDDNAANRELLCTVLEAAGHRVRAEADGHSAIVATRVESFDLALIDIKMPGMTGYELCLQLKADASTRDIPVIFLSALDDEMDKVKAFDAGGADYIVKPFKAAEVMARVNNQLRIGLLQRQMSAKNEELRKRNEDLLMSAMGQSPHAVSMSGGIVEPQSDSLIDDKYLLEEPIGSGGFGIVYKATHIHLRRPVAIKLLRPGTKLTPAEIDRFRREGISACRVEHPNAVAILDAGVTRQRTAYLVMELLVGATLRKEMLAKRTVSIARCAEIIHPICDVLAVAHAAGVIHRDIKPDNIFLHRARGVAEIVKVVDFGIAKFVGSEADMESGEHLLTSGPMGTPEYIAPERLMCAPYDGRADVYSVGCMLYQMLCGRVPFAADKEDPWAVALMHLKDPPPPLRSIQPDLPAAIDYVVMSALEKHPDNRPTARELAASFLHAAAYYPTEATVPPDHPPQLYDPHATTRDAGLLDDDFVKTKKR